MEKIIESEGATGLNALFNKVGHTFEALEP
jgi:hypothetical protein